MFSKPGFSTVTRISLSHTKKHHQYIHNIHALKYLEMPRSMMSRQAGKHHAEILDNDNVIKQQGYSSLKNVYECVLVAPFFFARQHCLPLLKKSNLSHPCGFIFCNRHLYSSCHKKERFRKHSLGV